MAPSGLSDSVWTLYVDIEGIWLSSPKLHFQPQVSLPTSIYYIFQFHPSLFLEMVCLTPMPSLTCFHLPGKLILTPSLRSTSSPDPYLMKSRLILSARRNLFLCISLTYSYPKSFCCTLHFPLYIMAMYIPILKLHSAWVTWREGSSLTHGFWVFWGGFLHIITLSSVPCTEPILNICSFS